MLKFIKIPVILLFLAVIPVMMTAPAFPQNSQPVQTSPETSITQTYFLWLEMGKAAIPELKKAIKSDNWRIRTHALLAMGQTKDQTLTPLVLDRLTNDPKQAVKNCAVMALGDLNEKSAVPILINLLPPNVKKSKIKPLPQQRLIVQSLGKIGDSRAITPLFSLLLSAKNEQLKIKITDALIAIHDPAVSKLILQNQSDSEQLPYIHAAKILGELPVDGAEDFLIALVGNDRLPVKNSAVISLGKIRSKKSVPILLPLLETDNLHLQANIAHSLTAIDDSSAVKPLCDLLSHTNPDITPDIAMTSARILSRMTDAGIEREVFNRFKQNHEINAPAAYILGQKKFVNAIPDIRTRLKDTTETGQDEMAVALGWMEDRESIPLLIKIAKRKNKLGASGAIWSLGHLKAEKAIEFLCSILKKQDRQLTGPAVFALGEIGDPSTVKPLINLYYESGFQYQMQIGLALSEIGGPQVSDFIKTNMDSGHPKRQKMAGYMILKSQNASLVPYAISLLNHPNETIVRYALGGLKNITGNDFNTISKWEEWHKKQNQ